MSVRVQSNLSSILARLGVTERQVHTRAAVIVKELVRYANKKMKYYTPRTARSTGRLREGIVTTMKVGFSNVYGASYVRKGIRYQYAIEYGNKRSDIIKGKPNMSFPVSSWKKGMSKLSLNGYYVFSRIRRGKYKGRHFTSKALKDTKNYMENKKNRYKSEISYILMKNINISGSI